MKQGQKRNNAIQNCMLFEGIEPEKSEQLLKEKAQCRTFQKGECIYTPEHFEKSLGILVKGRAVVEKEGGVLLNELSSGCCFGAETAHAEPLQNNHSTYSIVCKVAICHLQTSKCVLL